MCSIDTPPEDVCDEHTTVLTREQWDELQAMLDELPRVLPRLKRLLDDKDPKTA